MKATQQKEDAALIDFDEATKLVARAQLGDSDSFGRLYNMFFEHIYFFAFELMKEEQAAIDIVQETFVRAYRKIHTLKAPKAFPKWLNNIAYHLCMDTLERENNMDTSLSYEETTEALEGAFEEDTSTLPEPALLDDERRELVMRVIDELPVDQKTVVLLHYYEGLPAADIAEITGAKTNAIYKRLHDAREAIKRQLESSKSAGVAALGAVPLSGLPLGEGCKALQQSVIAGVPEATKDAVFGNITSELALAKSPAVAAAGAAHFAQLSSAAASSANTGLGAFTTTLIAASAALCIIGVGAVAVIEAGVPLQAVPAAISAGLHPATTPAGAEPDQPAPRSPSVAEALQAISPPLAEESPADSAEAEESGAEEVQVLSPPSIYMDTDSLVYASGTPVPLSQVLADAGVYALDSEGAPVECTVDLFETVDFAQPGGYVVSINATDANGLSAETKVLALYIQ